MGYTNIIHDVVHASRGMTAYPCCCSRHSVIYQHIPCRFSSGMGYANLSHAAAQAAWDIQRYPTLMLGRSPPSPAIYVKCAAYASADSNAGGPVGGGGVAIHACAILTSLIICFQLSTLTCCLVTAPRHPLPARRHAPLKTPRPRV